jgi:hypothetical protein
MKDIFFYYRKKDSTNRELIDDIVSVYGHSKVKLISGSVFNFIDKCTKEAKTDFVWIIELGTTGWEELISYNVETWDKDYLHIFESKSAKAYLAPKNIVFDKKAKDFLDKKFIKTDLIKSAPYDVFFICYDENNTAKNLRYIKEKRADVKVISGIKGIFNAHLEAANQSTTEFFWVVDADATVIDAFDFEYNVSEYDFDVVHIWKSYNPINSLEYGHGGVKLIPKHLLLTADEETTVDVTTSLTDKIKVIDEISNINNFATNPFNTWRSAFRECVKLASRSIARSNEDETNAYLDAWLNKGGNRPFGEYAKGGASAGEWYGKTYKGDKNALAMINDYNWLKEQFEAHIKLFPPGMFLDQEETKSEVNGNTEAITEAQALATS